MRHVPVFVVNCGSSSLKWALLDVPGEATLAAGAVERIGTDGMTYAAALATALAHVAEHPPPVAFAHRVVHGGERFVAPVVVDDAVLGEIRSLSTLAPLHNPANADGIAAARAAFPDVPHIAVFDTAFHATMPAHAHTYAVPPEWGVRRYGFHGTSHAYVSRRAAALLGHDLADVNTIVLHLGNGASACAVAGGVSVDTSMGITPLEGLVMGSRSGDVDPALVFQLQRAHGLGLEAIEDALNRRSGMLALAGSMDLRDVHRRVAAGDLAAAQALDVYCYRIRKYVGAYAAALGRLDAVVFTAGVGENDAVVRARSVDGVLGIVIDPARNAAPDRGERVISADGSPVAVLVVPTNEELEMARQALALVGAAGTGA